jgi:lipopolysaccharide transport system ATP-binding protein
METVIKIQNLYKEYRLGTIGYSTLREDLESWWAEFWGNPDPNSIISRDDESNSNQKHILALNNINLEVKQGERLGIIGPNGAGKTTLLKILSRISSPSQGIIKVKGSIASLIAVGTGMHPELTGRENIYLNGTILGLTKKDIDKRLDEIIDFSGVEIFIDTPVKRYSSGMNVRLGFAVAAHLNPDVLIVDEVLAVGDAEFRKKALGKMKDVSSRDSRTILFVSHNMQAIQKLCEKAVLLENGKITEYGRSKDVIEKYLHDNSNLANSVTQIKELINSLPPDKSLKIISININQNGELCNKVVNGESIEIGIQYLVLERTVGLRVYFDLLDNYDILIRTFHDDNAETIPTVEPGEYLSIATIPANFLAPRKYEIKISGTIFNKRSCTSDGIRIPLIVESTSSVNRGYPEDTIRSKLQPQIAWQTKKI